MKFAKDAMWHIVLSTPILFALAGEAIAEGTAKKAPSAKCLRAEINPFNGRVRCIDPPGASVEAPPEDAKLRCWSEARQGQDGAGCLREPGIN